MSVPLPLTGLKVIDMSNTVAAPLSGRVLAQYGADVIKIEPPFKDLIRLNASSLQLPEEDNNSPLFDYSNSGKRNICIDAKNEHGREVIIRLLESADVFITNTRQKSLEELGLSYSQLKDRFPRLIYAFFSGYGTKGPEKDRPGFDRSAFFTKTGIILDSAVRGDHPIRPPFAMGDIFSSSILLNGILMALYARGRTGKGTFVESSLYGCGLWACAASILNCQDKYGCEYPLGRYDPWDAFSECYECSDGEWVCIMRKNYLKEKKDYAIIFDMPELLTDPDLDTLDTIRSSGKIPEITAKLEKAFRQKTSDEWVKILLAVDVPVEKANHHKDNLYDTQAYENGYLEKTMYPDGETIVAMPPIGFSEYGRESFSQGSIFGKDTIGVLKEYGYSENEIKKLIDEKAVLSEK